MKKYSTLRYFKFKNPILKARYYNNHYYVIDNNSIIYILDNNCKIKLKQKVSNGKDLHSYTHLYSISCGVVGVPREDTLMCVIYKNDKMALTCKSKSISDNIVFTTLNNKANLLLNCTLDGKVSIFNRDTKSYSYIFDYQPDYLSSAFFSNKNIFVYIGYFNLENRILNLNNNRVIKFKLDNPIENGIFFDNDTKLFLADRAGNSIIYDCISYKVIDKKALFNEWVSSVSLYKNEKYILVGTRKNKLYLLEAQKNELVITIDVEAHGITSISIVEDQLILSYADSSFQVIDLQYQKDVFVAHINLHEYHEAKKVLEQNLFLYADESMQIFEAGYEKVLQKAKDLIAKSKIEEAIALVEPFMYNKKFKDELEALFMQQDHIAKFIEAIEKNNIIIAYTLASKYRVITSLGAYQSLEKKWELLFQKAKKVLESESVHGKNKAEELLRDYAKVEIKQELIKNLLTNADKFALADKAVKAQDFKSYFEFIKRYPFLKETLLYKKIESLSLSIKEKVLKAYSDNNMQEALKLCTQLLVFIEYEVFAKENITKIKAKISLSELIEQEKTKSIYELITKHPFLEYDDIFLKYNQIFLDNIKKAQIYIEKKEIQKGLKVIIKYLNISSLKSKISSIFKFAYLREIKEAKTSEYDVVKTVLRYKKLFGLDEHIKEFLETNSLNKELELIRDSTQDVDVEVYPNTILSI